MRGAVPFDAVQQVNFLGKIGIHCRFSIIGPFVGLEPDVDRVVGHFA